MKFGVFSVHFELSLVSCFLLAQAIQAQSPEEIWQQGHTVTDSSGGLLQLPQIYSPDHPDFDLAATPPRVDFGIIEMPGPGTPWGGWGECILGPDGKFYFSEGNHMSYDGATALIIAYDPGTKNYETVLSSQEICGWSDDEFGDGKIHGTPDVSPEGDMWLLTFFGPYPKKSDWGTNYHGGHLIHYNIYSREAEYLGRPVEDDSWPLHTWDWERNRLYAVGEWGMYQNPASGDDPDNWNPPDYTFDYGKILVYDTENRQLVRGATLPVDDATGEEIHWFRRSLLLDRETGMLYGTECVAPYRMVRYNPDTDRFSRMQSGLESPMISGPLRKNSDGSFYVFTQDGGFYKFFPEKDSVEYIGRNWDDGTWTENMRLSPGGRYLYYISQSAMGGSRYGLPLIQYNTETDRRKVLVFLAPYYVDTYGYYPENTYGIALSQDGSTIFTHVNGDFGGFRYGQPSIMHIHIPESEREEEVPVPIQLHGPNVSFGSNGTEYRITSFVKDHLMNFTAVRDITGRRTVPISGIYIMTGHKTRNNRGNN
jgi:hypothetical protein